MSDSTPLQHSKLTLKTKWLRFWAETFGLLRRRGQIALPDDDDQFEVPTVPWALPTEFNDNISHWSYLIASKSTQKALWITVTGNDKIDVCAYGAYHLLSSEESVRPAILVDVSKTESVFWPLLYSLGTALPDFREVLMCVDEEAELEGIYRTGDKISER
jgi:hypothetical protein